MGTSSRERMMRAALLVAALCAVACATRVEPIPTDKCAASVVASDDDRMYVFSLSEDSVVWFKFQKAEGGWSTWRPLADRKKMASGPKAVRFAQGTLMGFARGTDRLYYSTTMTAENEFSDWKPLSEDVTFSTPPVPLVDSLQRARLRHQRRDPHALLHAVPAHLCLGDRRRIILLQVCRPRPGSNQLACRPRRQRGARPCVRPRHQPCAVAPRGGLREPRWQEVRRLGMHRRRYGLFSFDPRFSQRCQSRRGVRACRGQGALAPLPGRPALP